MVQRGDRTTFCIEVDITNAAHERPSRRKRKKLSFIRDIYSIGNKTMQMKMRIPSTTDSVNSSNTKKTGTGNMASCSRRQRETSSSMILFVRL
jgi:hypothetical protein